MVVGIIRRTLAAIDEIAAFFYRDGKDLWRLIGWRRNKIANIWNI